MQQMKRPSSKAKRQLIFNTLFDAPGPLASYEIHRYAGLGKDSLSYHLRKMVASGILVPLEDGKYALQAFYYDQEALKSLEVSLELVVSIISSHTVWDYVDLKERDEFGVVSSHLEHYLRASKDHES